MASSQQDKPVHVIGSKDKSVGWYDKSLGDISPEASELLVSYAGIPADEVRDYILKTRDEAWDVFPFPCIGQFRFLDLSLYKQPSYPAILSKLKAGGKLLDLGCCMGQDIRKLVADGAPAENLIGAELRGDFIGLGHQFWRDGDSKLTFLSADIFDAEGPLKAFEGSLDFVHPGMMIHLFDWDRQRKMLERVVALLKPQAGSLILGQAVGHARGILTGNTVGVGSFQHNEATFKKLWDEVSELTGHKFDVRVFLDKGLGVGNQKRQWDDPDVRRLSFEVELLA